MLKRTYTTLERRTPARVKRLIPERWRILLGYRIKSKELSRHPQLNLRRELPIPPGATRDELLAYLSTYYIKEDGPSEGGRLYLNEAFERFLYTLTLVPEQDGSLLEIGANPYFMTVLLKRFRRHALTLVNYFGDAHPEMASQTLVFPDGREERLTYHNLNLERDRLPFDGQTFDVVLFCEVVEHLTNDPLKALLEIKRLLKPGGTLVLTTPNVARLENVSRLLSGLNIYDPYSGYGPYGRHNREYTLDELGELLRHSGFKVETAFTSDVHFNPAFADANLPALVPLLASRQEQLGQYIFIRASNASPAEARKPRWLYRSYLEKEMV